MRTPSAGTGRRLRLMASAALAGAALALTPFTAAVAETPAPTPSATPSAPPPATPPTPARDLSITISPDAKSQAVGDAMLWGFVTHSNVSTGYTATIQLPQGLELDGKPWRAGFECSVTNKRKAVCTNTKPVTGYQPFTMAVKALRTGTFTATATIDGDAPDANPANDKATTTITVTSREYASVKGIVWGDTNYNGRKDRGEKGIAGAKVLLWIRDYPTPIYTAYTGAGGAYTFTLDMTQNGGNWFTLGMGSPDRNLGFTAPSVGSDIGNSDVYAGSGTDGQREHFRRMPSAFTTVNLKAGVHLVKDGGLVARPADKGDLKGRIWNDADRDGTMDANEKGVAGVTVVLRGSHDGKGNRGAVKTKTDKNGDYIFRGLGPSKIDHAYGLYVAAPAGWAWTKDGRDTRFSVVEDRNDIPGNVAALLPDGAIAAVPNMDVVANGVSIINGAISPAGGEGELPVTGASAQGVAAGGAALLLGGLGLAFAGRRRRTA